jgi:hypothetical protein
MTQSMQMHGYHHHFFFNNQCRSCTASLEVQQQAVQPLTGVDLYRATTRRDNHPGAESAKTADGLYLLFHRMMWYVSTCSRQGMDVSP